MATVNLVPSNAVENSNGQITTTSKTVAAVFSKQHQHVCQKIESLECSDEFRTSNFSLVSYEHKGNTYRSWEMTKDGFVFLVMGFTGKKAALIKEAYINAFNQMEQQLRRNTPQPFKRERMLVVWENGNLTSSIPLQDDEFITSNTKLLQYITEPGYMSLQELVELSKVTNERILELTSANMQRRLG
ncbi:Rha family transcriptional regulator [Veronia pacifica]|uniref:Rha family transcriptional regulator n=1 Tax=Veronia pacifica TaxID=1080227 RepID=A0A1C3E9H8_9GAMM|nr:Rha family transcriptional regulator [Veronia pacifica]ODA29874.1 hypothetical protein A8L45_21480 [Veronia pacifica]